LALFALCPALALGQSGADLIPEDATFALAINSVAGVRDKGEKFLKDHDIKLGERRPSKLFNDLFKFLNLKKGVDEKAPAALVLGNLSKATKKERQGLEILGYLYAIIPVKDAREIAGNYGLKEADLKKPHKVEAGGVALRAVLKGKFLYIGLREDVITAATKAKALPSVLSGAQKAAMTKSDLALHLGANALGKMYGEWLNEVEKNLKRKDEKDDTESKQLIDALRGLRFVVGGVTFDEGGKINVIATFKAGKDGAAAKKFLTKLRAGPGASDLIGLPVGNPLVLFAAKGDGTSNVSMARALVNVLFDQGRIDRLLPGEERRELVSTFERLYKELKGSRVALYDNGDPTKQGRLTLLGILDIGDTEKHLAEMPNLVKRLNSAFKNAFKGAEEKAPTVSYAGKAEKLAGLDVNVVRVKAPGLTKSDLKSLKDYFGPDWDKVRIVVQGKKAIFLAGSNTALLKEAAANLEKREKGLAADKVVMAELARLSKERKLELHFNLSGLAALRKGEKPGPAKGLVSLSLTVEPDRLQLEVVAAKSEVKPFIHAFLGLPKEK
jgi:hypothetical protein